jgi:hypothetical protein
MEEGQEPYGDAPVREKPILGVIVKAVEFAARKATPVFDTVRLTW